MFRRFDFFHIMTKIKSDGCYICMVRHSRSTLQTPRMGQVTMLCSYLLSISFQIYSSSRAVDYLWSQSLYEVVSVRQVVEFLTWGTKFDRFFCQHILEENICTSKYHTSFLKMFLIARSIHLVFIISDQVNDFIVYIVTFLLTLNVLHF